MSSRVLVLSLSSLSIATLIFASACTSPHTTVRRNDGSQPGSSSGDQGSNVPSPSSDPTNPSTAPQPVPMTIKQETAMVNGNTRSYILAVPQNYDASKSYPLILALHGNPGSADDMLKAFPFDSIGGAAVVAYPQGFDENWDLGSDPATNVDMPFITALPNEIARKTHIDTSHVYAIGFSGGAFFLNQMACSVPGVFKAFASHSGGAPYNASSTDTWPNGCVKCAGTPTPAIMIHGSADTTVSLDDGKYAAACWATTDGCWQDPDAWPATKPTICRKADTCSGRGPVELCVVDGLGHEPWQDAPRVAWSFFQNVP